MDFPDLFGKKCYNEYEGCNKIEAKLLHAVSLALSFKKNVISTNTKALSKTYLQTVVFVTWQCQCFYFFYEGQWLLLILLTIIQPNLL